MSSNLTADAKKILRKWATSGWYVYLRPMSSRLKDPDRKETVFWSISVDCRMGIEPKQYRAEGYELDEVIKRLDLEVPKRPKGYKEEKPHPFKGWLAPEQPTTQITVKRLDAPLKDSPIDMEVPRPRKRPKDTKRKVKKVDPSESVLVKRKKKRARTDK